MCLRLDMVGVIHCRLQGLPHSTLTEARAARYRSPGPRHDCCRQTAAARVTRRGPTRSHSTLPAVAAACSYSSVASLAGPRPAITHGPSHSHTCRCQPSLATAWRRRDSSRPESFAAVRHHSPRLASLEVARVTAVRQVTRRGPTGVTAARVARGGTPWP